MISPSTPVPPANAINSVQDPLTGTPSNWMVNKSHNDS